MPQAGLLELVAHGIQDIYLIGNPQITFFKTVYKRHTNFSMEAYQLSYQDREIIFKIIEENIKTTNETGLPYF